MKRVDKWNVIWWVSEWHRSEVQTRDCGVFYGGCLVGYVGYSCISSSINCVPVYVGTSREKTSGVDLHAR